MVLLLSSVVEYVFPPFPGDTITLFGAFLVATRGWSVVAVFGATTLGSVLGAAIDWWLGVVLQRWRGRKAHPALDRLVAGFARHGSIYILLNRFVPGVRALFFVAAGMAGMRPLPVLAWATLSALAWNTLLMAAGLAVGASWETLHAWFATYTQVAWLLVACAALCGALAWRRWSR